MVVAGIVVALAVTPAVFVPALYDDFTLPKQSTLFLSAALVAIGLAFSGLPRISSRWLGAGLLAWCAAVGLSEMYALDWRGSLLGLYQYRQGALTQVAYILLFLGALRQGRTGTHYVVVRALAFGLAAAFCYTVVQAVGADPVRWWTDTSARAIGTIGNANELAAFAVVCLVLCSVLPRPDSRSGLASWVAVGAAVSFILFESESRSGIA